MFSAEGAAQGRRQQRFVEAVSGETGCRPAHDAGVPGRRLELLAALRARRAALSAAAGWARGGRRRWRRRRLEPSPRGPRGLPGRCGSELSLYAGVPGGAQSARGVGVRVAAEVAVQDEQRLGAGAGEPLEGARRRTRLRSWRVHLAGSPAEAGAPGVPALLGAKRRRRRVRPRLGQDARLPVDAALQRAAEGQRQRRQPLALGAAAAAAFLRGQGDIRGRLLRRPRCRGEEAPSVGRDARRQRRRRLHLPGDAVLCAGL
mmetsp:Transcript_109574/g.341498  ORF Transcript_109574/g.341498 Transcript_109574/m.341498 type:complete len:260 (-) Transcript_109574:828-1607(-)